MAAEITFACARSPRKRSSKAAGTSQQPIAVSEWDELTDAQRNALREWHRRMGQYREYQFAEAVFAERSNREAAMRRTCQKLAQLGWLESDPSFVAAHPTSANGPWRLSQRALDRLAIDSLDALIAAAPKHEPEPAAPAPVVPEMPTPTQTPTMLSMLERAAFEPSPYQQSIFDWIRTGSGDGIVNAVAGSGKTTTLVQAAHLLTTDALFVAFNKHIAEALAAKLAGTRMVAKTIHSVGYGMVASAVGMRLQTDGRKYRKLARDYVTAHDRDLLRLAFGLTAGKDAEQTVDPEIAAQMYTAEASGTLHMWAEAVCDLLPKLIDFARLTLTNPSDEMALSALMARFDLLTAADVPAIERAAITWLPDVLELGAGLAKVQGVIDFTDMIWLPERWNLTPRQLPWVFVDECQDLNAAQLALVLRLRARSGRMLFVGDPRQAIMGFAGADNESFWTIQRKTGAREMPLSICYRCPSSHLALAREIVPQIEARPGAPIGVLQHISEQEARQIVQPGDMMLCRLTAPLVAECIRLIKAHVPARVRGHDIGKQLADMVKAVTKLQGYHFGEFGQYLTRLEEIHRQKLVQHDASESQLEALADRVEAIRACHEEYDCHDADDLARQIEALFADETNGVMLSTVHRAKGLENPRIFILKPEKLPLAWPKQQPWEAEQEENIRYVALTRATEALIFVES